MKKNLDKSIIITGASVTGKTTLSRRLSVHFGLDPMPVHMTRDIRDGEIRNVDGIFITEEEFKKNIRDNYYIQESLRSAYFSGTYSGCPREWIEATIRGDWRCFVCPTVVIAGKIKKILKKNIFWIHLTTNEEVRRQRLMKRNPDMKKEDFNERIKRGGVFVDTTGCDLIIDTSRLNAWEIFFHALIKL